ncbi:OmpA family protein [Falsiroseomonas stagni]|uniref:Outer membrane protein OmpA n=1 Tax=Falsiroseomonas stagni DSM 19981 TaxID=1123062 RepID=A0A1I3ZPS8_9PROT|nr:OmpA family protein [Falsiroseomonas stagni]SFK45656.1 Outer membrane protein OmpA [Falsiroseomonas stagni DSM 19981]
MRYASLPLAGVLLATGLGIGVPAPAMAQNDPAALQLIEQLRPRTRGIRLPAPADATAPASPVAPAAVAPGGPSAQPAEAPAPDPAKPPVAAAPVAPPPLAAVAPGTTAPAGVAAVSITVTFPSGSASLTPQAEATLAPLGRALSSPDLAPFRFRIEGHTDSVGDAASNQRLSERRAEAVRGYLVAKHGVAPGRLEAVGLGETRLLVPTPDGWDEPRNRRVQVINLDD